MDNSGFPRPLCQRAITLENISIDEKLRPREEERLPLYKDSRRRLVFVGILIAWFFKGFDDSVISMKPSSDQA
ncbi:hypothetical protein PG993_007397 [Apiospora rasikravindrae]|uniref:Uncharacterized protein n=1 Tax=Apiospora rasikravindrae TaxID=990691 RepID=A0ABR1SXC8_9PEZI